MDQLDEIDGRIDLMRSIHGSIGSGRIDWYWPNESIVIGFIDWISNIHWKRIFRRRQQLNGSNGKKSIGRDRPDEVAGALVTRSTNWIESAGSIGKTNQMDWFEPIRLDWLGNSWGASWVMNHSDGPIRQRHHSDGGDFYIPNAISQGSYLGEMNLQFQRWWIEIIHN